MANKIVKPSEGYEIAKQRQPAKTFAKIFALAWTLVVAVPATYLAYTHSADVKHYAVVRAVYETNRLIMDEYRHVSAAVMSKIDVNKHVARISVPEIKLDKIAGTTEKANKAAGILSAVGVKGADKVADTAATLQKEVDKVNSQLREATDKVTKTLASDFNKAIKDELDQLAKSQMQKQLRLSEANYKNLAAERYGIFTADGRKISKSIYAELAKNDVSAVKTVFGLIETYFFWLALGVTVLVFLVSLVPAFIVWK
ncbi:MAG: hypothetical protein LBI17_03550, partial [Rickettsiales bacterium]|nr:hypothetical protein [Rickettsiales bacterium]